MSSQLRQELTNILTANAGAESLPASASVRSLPSSSHATPNVFKTLLILVIFATIGFIALRPILPFGQPRMSAKVVAFGNTEEEDEKIEYHDPLFQPFD